MKKFLILLGFLLLIFVGFIVYDTFVFKDIARIETEDMVVEINNIYIYGTHLNLEGNYSFTENAELVLYDGEMLDYKINADIDTQKGITNFNLSDLKNDGLYLDNIPVGNYYLFLRVRDETISQEENQQEESWKYYSLKNNSNYPETTYYTMNNYGKKIVIKSEDSYPTMMLNVAKSKNEDVYDIVIDPGHGGRDGGASKDGYKETDFTLDIASEIKKQLEEYGFKVKLTHEIGQLKKNDKLQEYGVHGRAVIPREVNAKYLFSIHFNSSNYASVSGLEIYTAKNINYNLAKDLVSNLTSIAGLGYSNNKVNKMFDSIYSRNFTKAEIEKSIKDYEKDELNAYDITTNSNYYYMIRETGGIVTGAYVDNRNSEIIGNPYVNSNVGTEAYLLELGYLSNKKDLNNLINNKNKYAKAISDSIKTLYDNIEE